MRSVHNLFVVEDDADLRRLVTRMLTGLPLVRVIECDSAECALEWVDETPPSILIADLGLPGLSGIELIAHCRARWPEVAVLVTTGHRSRFHQQLARLTYVEVWEKPYPIIDLRERVQSILVAEEKRAFAPFGVIDYLQMAGFANQNLVLRVTLESGEAARMEIVDGEIWSCRVGEFEGEDALRVVLFGETRRIDFNPLAEKPPQRQIEASTQRSLLEIARMVDEHRVEDAEAELADTAPPAPENGGGGVAVNGG